MGKLEESTVIKKVWNLLNSWKNSDKKHASHVTDLAVMLFDQLKEFHNMGAKELELLKAAAILHDIGWKQGRKRHHKASRDIIIASPVVSPSRELRVMIGLIARYHRKSMPEPTHKYFQDLDNNSKELVIKLAAILRLADGLDASHKSPIRSVKTTVTEKEIIVHATTTNLNGDEIETGKDKADLLARAFTRKVKMIFLLEQQHQE